jgi:hypothetical protein
MRISDYDVGLVSPQLMDRARLLGMPLIGQGTRTNPLSGIDQILLGLEGMSASLGGVAGRPVNFMLYLNMGAVQRSPSIFAPR